MFPSLWCSACLLKHHQLCRRFVLKTYLPTVDDLSALHASRWRKRDVSSKALAKKMEKNGNILSADFHGGFSAQIL